jgi:glutamine---fructose-6-phosphate transaminase (isomerizing)
MRTSFSCYDSVNNGERFVKYIDEVRQHPAALNDMISHYFAKEPAAETIRLKHIIEKSRYKKIVFTGMGSSLFAGYPPCIFLRNKGIHADSMEANELLRYYGTQFFDDNTLVIAVSQSGDSPEVVNLCSQISKENLVIVSNDETRALFQYGENKFLIKAGIETKSASKTYTNTIAVLMYLALVISQENACMFTQLEEALLMCEKHMHDILLDWGSVAGSVYEFIGRANYLPVVGAGPSYATASQAEILLMEIASIYASRYTPGQFLHGTVEIVNDEFRAIVLDFHQESRSDIDQVLRSIVQFSGKALVFTNRETKFVPDEHFLIIEIPADESGLSGLLTPMLEIIPIELMINDIAFKKNITPGVLRSVKK